MNLTVWLAGDMQENVVYEDVTWYETYGLVEMYAEDLTDCVDFGDERTLCILAQLGDEPVRRFTADAKTGRHVTEITQTERNET
jgi:hypothetical protein